MKVFIDIDEELIVRIKKVAQCSLNNFIIVAIENQIAMETSKSTDILDISDIDINLKLSDKDIIKKQSVSIPKDKYDFQDLRVEKIKFNENEFTVRRSKKGYKNDYIWGQYNKLFPIKFTLRYLAKIQSDYPKSPVILTEFHEKCSNEAIEMKKLLIENDTKNARIWGENFSAGFPDDDPEKKSQYRFISHFIGHMNNQGDTVGALGEFGFASIKDGKIFFTLPGLKFAKLRNPILDDDPYSTDLLSGEERLFVIGHLKNNLHQEWSAINSLLKWINQGENTPETINKKIKSLDIEGKWTEKMVNTMRTGFLGRMYDLNLIYREKDGNRSFYFITEFAKEVGELL